jgi:hypothetical protein
MAELPFDNLLKLHDLTFFYNKLNKIWWLRQPRPETGNPRRTNPASAKNQEEAETAARKFIHRQFK